MSAIDDQPPATTVRHLSPLRRVAIDPLADDRWSELVSGSAAATIFHDRRWLALLHAQYRYPIAAQAVVDAGGKLVAGIPLADVRSRLTGRRTVALPFSDLCPPLIAPGAPAEALHVLIAGLRSDHEHDGRDVEIRSAVAGWPAGGEPFYHHEIALEPDLDAIRGRMRSNMRRGATRAQREGITVTRETDVAALRSFYAIHLHTRRRQGVPTQPWSFIRRFADLFEAGHGFVLLARSEGSPVAAAVYLCHGTTLTYKYGASLTEHLGKRPNHAIFMESTRWGAEHGMTQLDLGRTDRDNDGLRAFKLGWGGQERELTYARLSRKRASDGTHGAPPLARALITHGPPVVGRLIGAAFYRHAG